MTASHHNEIESVLSFIRTREEQERVHVALGELVRRADQKGNIAFEKILESRLPADAAEVFEKIIGSLPYKEDHGKLKTFLASLKTAVEKMRVMTLDVALEPSEEMTKRISLWVTDNVGSDIVLAFNTDQRIVGGARIMFAGRYIEKTLDQKIDDFFKKEQEKILQDIR
jgi:F0F1-type ATP synthase delta subunit